MQHCSKIDEDMTLSGIRKFLRRKPFGLITRSRVHVEIGHVFNTYYYISENEDTVFKARRCLTTNCITVFDFNENVICKLKTNIYGTRYVLQDVAPCVIRYMEETKDQSDCIDCASNNISDCTSDISDYTSDISSDKANDENTVNNETNEINSETNDKANDENSNNNEANNENTVNNAIVNDKIVINSDELLEDDNLDNRLVNKHRIHRLNFTMADYLNYKLIEENEIEENEIKTNLSLIENTKIPDNKVIRKLEIQYDTTQKDQGKPRALEIKINELTLINKKPYFNIETNSYSLNFSGRVTKPSAKNFQVIHPLDPTYITLTFGKESHDSYILDFSYPWTALHAFCVGLSALDHKYGCD